MIALSPLVPRVDEDESPLGRFMLNRCDGSTKSGTESLRCRIDEYDSIVTAPRCVVPRDNDARDGRMVARASDHAFTSDGVVVDLQSRLERAWQHAELWLECEVCIETVASPVGLAVGG